MQLLAPVARACILKGMWAAVCPRPECNNAEALPPPGQNPQVFYLNFPKNKCTLTCFWCTYCNMQAPIEWPPDPEGLMTPLALRPIPHTRNWFPLGHEEAVKWGVEHGQTEADLWLENADHGILA